MRMQREPARHVPRAQHSQRIPGNVDRRRDLGKDAAVRATKLELAVGPPRDLITLFLDGAMVSPTEHREIGERRRPSLSPVPDVMALAEAHAAAGEATAAIAML